MISGTPQYQKPQRELLRWSAARDLSLGNHEFKEFDTYTTSLRLIRSLRGGDEQRRDQRDRGSTHSGGTNGTGGRDKKSFRTTIKVKQKKQWNARPTKYKRSANITAHFALIAGSQERIVRNTFHQDTKRQNVDGRTDDDYPTNSRGGP